MPIRLAASVALVIHESIGAHSIRQSRLRPELKAHDRVSAGRELTAEFLGSVGGAEIYRQEQREELGAEVCRRARKRARQ
jgi:hypothetical protein